MRPIGHFYKHTLDEDFFSNLNNISAYIFGFWMADGNIHHDKHYKVSFSSKDLEHLESIRNCLKSDTKIYKCHGLKNKNCYELNIYSKKLFKDIEKLGGTVRKSITLSFPRIPDEYLSDFIRGYFDGDGSVHHIKYISTRNHKIYTEIRSNFTCGSLLFLKSLRKILVNKLKLKNKVIGQYGPHQFKLGYGQTDTYNLLNYMYYPNHKLSLERKRKYLDRFLDK